MVDLVLRPTGLPEKHNKPWALQLRYHDLSGTDYVTLARVDDDTARQIMKAGAPSWLFGEPDWDERLRKCELERARALREQADAIDERELTVEERQVFDGALRRSVKVVGKGRPTLDEKENTR